MRKEHLFFETGWYRPSNRIPVAKERFLFGESMKHKAPPQYELSKSTIPRIFIYGDSNTWGKRGSLLGRYESWERWPNIVQEKLGDAYDVVADGVCGRIAGDHDHRRPERNGKSTYVKALRDAAPADIVIIALGTNDAKPQYGLSLATIVEDLVWYQRQTDSYVHDHSDEMHGVRGIVYLGVANVRGHMFGAPAGYQADLTAALQAKGVNVLIPPDLKHVFDGVHYSAEDHQTVAECVYKKIKEMSV